MGPVPNNVDYGMEPYHSLGLLESPSCRIDIVQKIKDFWSASFTSDKVAFWFEMVSFIFTVGASLTLAITARHPNMSFIYPGFFLGAVTSFYANYRRGIAWSMLLTFYFAVVNIFGFGRSLAWW
jgi:hypothetical protein